MDHNDTPRGEGSEPRARLIAALDAWNCLDIEEALDALALCDAASVALGGWAHGLVAQRARAVAPPWSLAECGFNDTPILAGALIHAGLPVDAAEESATGLGWAAMGNFVETARIFIEAGALIDKPNSEGRTPLMLAAAAGSLGTLQLLLEAGARVERLDASGRTAMQMAQGYGEHEAARLIGHWRAREEADRMRAHIASPGGSEGAKPRL